MSWSLGGTLAEITGEGSGLGGLSRRRVVLVHVYSTSFRAGMAFSCVLTYEYRSNASSMTASEARVCRCTSRRTSSELSV